MRDILRDTLKFASEHKTQAAIALSVAATYAAGTLLQPGSADASAGVDLMRHCNEQGKSLYLKAPVFGENVAFRWRCIDDADAENISITLVCRDQYNDNRLKAVTENPNNPYNWDCVR